MDPKPINLQDNGHASTIKKATPQHEATLSLQSSADQFIDSFRTIAKVEGKEGGSYYHAWQSAIAVQFQDEYSRQIQNGRLPSNDEIHVISNKAAKNFLDLLLR